MCVDYIDQRIQAVQTAEERQVLQRTRYLRCDEIRKREMVRNFEAIQQAVRLGVDKIKNQLPDRKIVFTENPSRFFVVRDPAPTGATVNVGMSLNGATVLIETQKHDCQNWEFPKSTQAINVGVEGDSTYFSDHDGCIPLSKVVDIILAPLLS